MSEAEGYCFVIVKTTNIRDDVEIGSAVSPLTTVSFGKGELVFFIIQSMCTSTARWAVSLALSRECGVDLSLADR